jgi:hypothetical protein
MNLKALRSAQDALVDETFKREFENALNQYQSYSKRIIAFTDKNLSFIEQLGLIHIPLASKPITSFLGAAEAVGNAWETGVMRPLTTAALVTDPTSPLYRGEVFRSGEEGRPGGVLEPQSLAEAIGMAWDRSESVDLGSAALSNPLLMSKAGLAGGFNPLGLLAEATQINTYNPWSDKSVDEAASNPFHFFVASAINLSPDIMLPPPIRSARIAAQGAAGLRTTVQSAEDLTYLRGLWNEHSVRKQQAEAAAQQVDETSVQFDEFGLPVSALADAPEVKGLGGAVRLRQSAGYARGTQILEEGPLTPESATQRLQVLAKEARESGNEKLATQIENSLNSIDPQTLVDDPNFWPRVIGQYEFDLNKFGPNDIQIPEVLVQNWDNAKNILKEQKASDAEYLARARQQRIPEDAPDPVQPSAQDPYSMLIEDLTKETKWGKILAGNPLVANATGVNKVNLAKIIAKTDDPNTVNELILASRGDIEALYNLSMAAPDHVWALGNMNDAIRNAWIEKGLDFQPTGAELRKVQQVFSSALERNVYFREVRDMFMSGDGFLRGGSTWMPTKSMLVEQVRAKGRKTYYAVKQADYEDAPQWLYKTLDGGNGAPVTTFLQWSSSRQPLGSVSLSGTRPEDWVVELYSQLDSVPLFRGTKEITVGFEPVLRDGELVPIRMSASMYRQQVLQELIEEAEATNIAIAWRNMEDKLVRVMADDAGVSPLIMLLLLFVVVGKHLISVMVT